MIRYFTFFSTNKSKILLKFRGVTFSGYVRFLAIFSGIPTSLKAILGSGLITVLAEKSTLFPSKFCLNLPYLPFNRSEIFLIFFLEEDDCGVDFKLIMIEATIFSI